MCVENKTVTENLFKAYLNKKRCKISLDALTINSEIKILITKKTGYCLALPSATLILWIKKNFNDNVYF